MYEGNYLRREISGWIRKSFKSGTYLCVLDAHNSRREKCRDQKYIVETNMTSTDLVFVIVKWNYGLKVY